MSAIPYQARAEYYWSAIIVIVIYFGNGPSVQSGERFPETTPRGRSCLVDGCNNPRNCTNQSIGYVDDDRAYQQWLVGGKRDERVGMVIVVEVGDEGRRSADAELRCSATREKKAGLILDCSSSMTNGTVG
jgi:hypothetical protein